MPSSLHSSAELPAAAPSAAGPGRRAPAPGLHLTQSLPLRKSITRLLSPTQHGARKEPDDPHRPPHPGVPSAENADPPPPAAAPQLTSRHPPPRVRAKPARRPPGHACAPRPAPSPAGLPRTRRGARPPHWPAAARPLGSGSLGRSPPAAAHALSALPRPAPEEQAQSPPSRRAGRLPRRRSRDPFRERSVSQQPSSAREILSGYGPPAAPVLPAPPAPGPFPVTDSCCSPRPSPHSPPRVRQPTARPPAVGPRPPSLPRPGLALFSSPSSAASR